MFFLSIINNRKSIYFFCYNPLLFSFRFTWRTENGQGFNLEYPQISLHATSRDLNNFHSECLYLMFEDNNNENATQHIQSHIDGDYGYNANVLGGKLIQFIFFPSLFPSNISISRTHTHI